MSLNKLNLNVVIIFCLIFSSQQQALAMKKYVEEQVWRPVSKLIYGTVWQKKENESNAKINEEKNKKEKELEQKSNESLLRLNEGRQTDKKMSSKDLYYLECKKLTGNDLVVFDAEKNKHLHAIDKKRKYMEKCSFCSADLIDPIKNLYPGCVLCLKTCYCDDYCKKKHWESEHKNECLKFIENKENKLIEKAIKNIKECLAKNLPIDPVDYCYSWFDTKAENKNIIETARQKMKESISDEQRNKYFKNNPVCCTCNKKLENHSGWCTRCNSAFYCEECYKDNNKTHDKEKCLKCAKKRRQERRIEQAVKNVKECIEKNKPIDEEDYHYCSLDTKEENKQTKDLAHQIVTNKNRDKLRKEQFDKSPSCEICHEKIPSHSSYCSLCQRAFYCTKCSNEKKSHSYKECLKKIKAAKHETLKDHAKKLAEPNEKYKKANPIDIFYAFEDEKVEKENRGEINKAIDIRLASNSNKKLEFLLSNPKCSICGAPLSIESNPTQCPFCLKAFFCNKCKDFRHDKQECLKNINLENEKRLEEKRTKKAIKSIKKTNAKNERPDPVEYSYSFKDKNPDNEQHRKKAHELIIKSPRFNLASKYSQESPFCPICNEKIDKRELCTCCLKIWHCEKCKKAGKLHDQDKCLKDTIEEKKIYDEEQKKANEEKKKIVHKTQNEEKKDYLSKISADEFNLSPYLKHYLKDENIDYVQLETVNQFNDIIIQNVIEKAKTLNKNGVCAAATCGAHSIRSALLIDEFLQSGGNSNQALEQIKSEAKAIEYLAEMIENRIDPCWLEQETMKAEILRLEKSKNKNGLNNRITILSMLELLKNNEIEKIRQKFKEQNNYHIFIVNTGIPNEIFYDQKNIVEKEKGKTFDKELFEKIIDENLSKNHWYTILIQKTGDKIKCISIDSYPTNNHTDMNKKPFEINKTLCQHILNVQNKTNFIEKMNIQAKTIILEHLEQKNENIDIDLLSKKFSCPELDEQNFFFNHTKKIFECDPVKFIFLKTVDENDDKISSAPAKEYSARHQNLEYFAPNGICGSLAIRNAILLDQYFKTNELEAKHAILEQIRDRDQATTRLKLLIKEGRNTSFLTPIEIKGQIGEEDLVEDITVLNSAIDVETTMKNKIDEIRRKFKNKNYSHTFIVNTSDIGNLENFDEEIKSIERKEGIKLDKTDIEKFKNEKKSANDWYVFAIEKHENTINCFIIDTKSNESITGIKSLQYAFLCYYLLGLKSNQLDAYKRGLKKTLYASIEEAVFKSKKIKEDKDYSGKFTTRKNSEDLPDELEEIVYNGSTWEVKELIDIIKRNTSEAENLLKAAQFNQKKEIRKKIFEQYKSIPKIYIFNGPNGTGKSELAKLMAKKTNRKLYFIRCGLLGTKYQYSDSKDISNEIFPVIKRSKKCKPSIVVLDEVDAIIKDQKNEEASKGSPSAALCQIIDYCEEENLDIIFIATTNHPEILNKKLRDRGQIIDIPLPNEAARKEMIKFYLFKYAKILKCNKKIDLEFNALDLDQVSKKTDQFSIRSIKKILGYFLEVERDKMLRNPSIQDKKKLNIGTEDLLVRIELEKENIEKLNLSNEKNKKYNSSFWPKLGSATLTAVKIAAPFFLTPAAGMAVSAGASFLGYFMQERTIKKHYKPGSYMYNKKMKALNIQRKTKITGYNTNVKNRKTFKKAFADFQSILNLIDTLNRIEESQNRK